MSELGTYNFKGAEDFVIENNIIKGIQARCPITHGSYGELILDRMRADPSFVGQIDGLTGRQETFSEMTEKSVKCAMWLKKLNVQPGDVIGICTHNQPDMYVPCFASLFIGAIYNAWWDVGLTIEMARHFITLTRPKVVFVNESTASVALEVVKETGAEIKIIVIGKIPGLQSMDDVLATQDSEIVPDFVCTKLTSLDHPATIRYTSGSTGLPKGVVHSHRSFFDYVIDFAKLNDMNHVATTMLFSPLSWISGTSLMLRGATVPETRVIYPEFTEESAFQLIERYKVTWMLMGISTAFRLQKSPVKANYDLSSLEFIMVTGAILKEDRQKALAEMFPHTTIRQAYGSTELGGTGVRQEVVFKSGSCGRVPKNITMKVIDPDTGKALGPNQTGEACFKSPCMMTCYYGNPEATREAIDADGWLHTGDLMQYDEEGHVFFIDRLKDMIKYRGHHVSPSMIEQVLLTHSQVVQAAVFAIPHEVDDEHPSAFVVRSPNAKVTKEDLEKLVSDSLPDCMRLRGGVRFVEELPHTSSGKVSRSDLKNLAKSYATGMYNYKASGNFVIEDGIIKGVVQQDIPEYESYGEMVLERMKSNPNFVGQVDGLTGREETLTEMTEKSVKCAMWLRKLNVQPGDIIAICTHNQPDMYVPCFASLYIGAIFNAWWDVGLTREVAKYFITLTNPKVLFVHEASANMALEVVGELGVEIKIVVFGKLQGFQSLDDILATQESKVVTEFRCTKLPSLDHPAVIIYTSGSTALPKGVVHTHKSLFENVTRFGSFDEIDNVLTTMLFTPLSWISGIYAMLRVPVVPNRKVIYPEFTEETTFQLIEKFKVEWLVLGTSTAFRLQKSPAKANYDMSSLKLMLIGGASLKEENQKALAEMFPRIRICQGYGSTELGCAGVRQELNFKSGSCGTVTKNIKLKVADPETGKPLGPNQTGEACFKFPFMMTCYYKNPEATREVIDAEGWLHTGDLMQYDEEGNIFVVDRMNEMIKYRGNHVSPAMIEQALQNHPQVLEAAVLSIPHDVDDEHPIAFVVKVPNAEVTKEDLQKLVSETLPDHMKLRGGVVFLEELPRTPSSKVSRSELRNLAKAHAYS